MVSVNRNIVRYNKYLVVVTVVVVFVSYCYSYCDFVRTFYSHCWTLVFKFVLKYPIYSIFRKGLIILGLFHYKY